MGAVGEHTHHIAADGPADQGVDPVEQRIGTLEGSIFLRGIAGMQALELLHDRKRPTNTVLVGRLRFI
jgi:hypothetical protein